MAQVVALEFTSPLWVALLAPLFLGERLTPIRLFAAFLGFTGTLVIAQPSIHHIPPGVIAAAAAAVCFATTAIFTKILTRTEPIISILFWLTLMQTVFGIVCAGIDGDMTLPTAATAPWLVVVGLCGLSAHFCLTQALSIAPATVVMPLDFARLPVVALVGILVYGEPLGMALVAGAAIILAANWINLTQPGTDATRGVSAR
jgi:drug/metabolite transporter (DMT)-like permease